MVSVELHPCISWFNMYIPAQMRMVSPSALFRSEETVSIADIKTLEIEINSIILLVYRNAI